MITLVGLSILALAWAFVCFIGHGYANTVEHVSWYLHRHARATRERHERRAHVVAERWVRELESGGVE